MAQPAPKTASDGTVDTDANGKVTVNNGQGPIAIANGQTSTIQFTYQGGASVCELKIKFHRFKPGRINNGGMVQVDS